MDRYEVEEVGRELRFRIYSNSIKVTGAGKVKIVIYEGNTTDTETVEVIKSKIIKWENFEQEVVAFRDEVRREISKLIDEWRVRLSRLQSLVNALRNEGWKVDVTNYADMKIEDC